MDAEEGVPRSASGEDDEDGKSLSLGDKAGVVVKGRDFWAALVLAIVIHWVSSEQISIRLAKDLFAVGTSVLAVIFSVYFASIAIIMSSGDQEFVGYLVHRGTFQKVLFGFKVTLWLLFGGLVASLGLYSMVSVQIESGSRSIGELWLASYCFVVAWGIFATLEASLTAIRHSRVRVLFEQIVRDARKRMQGSEDEDGSDGGD